MPRLWSSFSQEHLVGWRDKKTGALKKTPGIKGFAPVLLLHQYFLPVSQPAVA
jgi:hypothetical protein